MFDKLRAAIFRKSASIDDAAAARAFADPLTQLPTRHVMLDRLREARGARIAGALALCDLDLMKHINDQHGHAAGDEVLKTVALRLGHIVADGAWVARIGGDEFVAFLPGAGIGDAQRVLSRCMDDIRRPISLSDGSTIIATMSVGLATFASPSVDEVLKAVDVAMYAAKARGRDRLVVFDDDTRKIVTARRELAATVVELQERNRALRDEARTDALTGLRNRLALDELLDSDAGDPNSRLAAAAVAFVDIDHFGDYNHLHGDAGGDEALRRVAAAVRGCSRDPDLVFRKGGEELVVVIPDAAPGDALVAAERIRSSVQALGIAHAGSRVSPCLTVTIGLASGGAGLPLRQRLVAASELAMRAKVTNGRNRVHDIDMRAAWSTAAPAGLPGQAPYKSTS
jgi:two-component system, cell cycle response regulator